MPHIKELAIHGFKSFARETRIPFKNSMNVFVGPNGSGKSCHYDTRVLLADGREIRIGDLVEEQLKSAEETKNLDDGIYVEGQDKNPVEIISLNKDSMKIEKKIISKFIRRDGEIIYKIRTRTGKEVKATGCHPVMIFNEGKVESALIRDLQAGSLIATPRMLCIEGEDNFDKDIARLIGYIIGDGYIAEDRIEFVNKDEEVLDDFRKIIKEKFAVKMMERFEKNITRIYIRDKSFVKYIRDLFNPESKTSITSGQKKIPSLLLKSNKKIISNLISGLYDTDGSARKDIAVLEFCTKNRELAEQIQGLLLRFGIASKIKKRLCCACNTQDKIKREYFYIYIYGVENLSKFFSAIPLRVKYKSEIIKSFAEKQTEPNPNADLLPQSVNFIIRDAVKDLGIKMKPIRKEYPSLCAYLDNRCAPSRQGLLSFMALFENKLVALSSAYANLKLDQLNLVQCMNKLHISGWQASQQIGMNKAHIRTNWQTNKFQAKPENLQRFYDFIKSSMALRILRAKDSIAALMALAHSDIYWDSIASIDQESKEEFVYDLTIEDNHNFIANNIFVHNSNVTDSICFVLGRMGVKSMRAKRLSNLIFAGTHQYKPAGEASVEIVFDNADKGFSLDSDEVSIKRILRKNGQGVYKINGEIKTRQEILELLSQAGIDPNGFNIILQGEIDSFVKMTPEERRQVIEEVAGISIYEMRKKHSMQELEKTESRLKETNAILRERNSYLKNLEEERKHALHRKKMEEDISSFKATISHKMIAEKHGKIEEINGQIAKEQDSIGKTNALIEKTQAEVAVLSEKINHITSNIQKSTGLEQERLNSEISDIRAEMAGLQIKQQGYESQLRDMEKRKEELESTISNVESEISEASKSKSKPSVKKDLELKKKQLEQLEENKRKLFILKSSLSSMNYRIDDKQRQMQKMKSEYDFTFGKLQQMESDVVIKDPLEVQKEKIVLLRSSLEKAKQELESMTKIKIGSEKQIAVLEKDIDDQEKIKSQVSSLDICPLCKTKITEEHINHVVLNSESQKKKSKAEIDRINNEVKDIAGNSVKILDSIRKTEEEMKIRSQDIMKLELISEKKESLRKYSEEIKQAENEHKEFLKKRETLEGQISGLKSSEENFDSLRLEIQEMERVSEGDLGLILTQKQRDLERDKNILKQITRQITEFAELLKEINEKIGERQKVLDDKNDTDRSLKERFKKTLDEKNQHQEKIHFYERNILQQQNSKHLSEEKINNLKIDRAQFLAQKEAIEQESQEFKDAKILKNFSIEELRKKIEETQIVIARIGSVNMRALEVYDDIKKEYEKIQEKVNTILSEKEEILKVIEDIDKKKKRAFTETLGQINELFSRNFSQLSEKGIATLQPVDKDNLFEEGIEMLIKVGKGKYFDTHSLSGGEKSLISLALIFAIQEYKPYCFYIFDEIDAALDRRNSERLAALLKRYMNKGQYIIITHNDSLITEAPVIYGVSMQDKISKVLSLEV